MCVTGLSRLNLSCAYFRDKFSKNARNLWEKFKFCLFLRNQDDDDDNENMDHCQLIPFINS